jgi:hypothetical protein
MRGCVMLWKSNMKVNDGKIIKIVSKKERVINKIKNE